METRRFEDWVREVLRGVIPKKWITKRLIKMHMKYYEKYYFTYKLSVNSMINTVIIRVLEEKGDSHYESKN